MNLPALTLGGTKIVALALVAFGAGFLAFAFAMPGSVATRLLSRYVTYLDRSLRALFLPENGKRIVTGQVLAAFGVVLAQLTIGVRHWPVGILVAVFAPAVGLARARKKHIALIEDQIDGFIVSLANSLKTVPSPGAALEATTVVLRQPMRQEIEQVLSEMRVGSTLEQALVAMSSRLGSKSVDVAFSAVLIGLRVGGNLPFTLERTAGTIREMNRLFGVVRSKTGEGRAQLWVLALFPAGAAWAFNAVKPGYFEPLQQSIYGQVAIGVAVTLWLAALLLARKILTVDI